MTKTKTADYVSLLKPKPRCSYNHYSNPQSQGALICETAGFPTRYKQGSEEIACAYADRLAQWDYDRYRETCKLAGTGEQGWASALPRMTDQKLKEFAKFALTLPVLPTHVRIVHHFNVATGYSCPTIEAIYPL